MSTTEIPPGAVTVRNNDGSLSVYLGGVFQYLVGGTGANPMPPAAQVVEPLAPPAPPSPDLKTDV